MKIKILLCFLFACSAFAASAQNFAVHNLAIKKDSTNLKISFSLKVDRLPTNAKVVIIPVLLGDSTKLLLEPLTFIGRSMRITMQRKGIVIPANYRSKFDIVKSYTAVIPFKSWMSTTTLKLNTELTACNKIAVDMTSVLLDNEIYTKKAEIRKAELSRETINIQHKIAEFKKFETKISAFPFVHSMADYNELRQSPKVATSAESKFYFRLNETEIDTTYLANREALQSLKSAIELVGSYSSVGHAKIVIYGTASPEGSEIYNKKLAQYRADWMFNYISSIH